MKKITLLLLVTVALAGCGDRFVDEEMHFGIQEQLRPYAVIVEPPEAAPGETVQVTLLARAPSPGALDISWRVALDYDLGLYEVDEVERNYRPVTADLPVADADGFVTQTFAWTVPDSALLLTSALPKVLADPILSYLVANAAGSAIGSPPRRDAVDAWLKSLTAADVAAMSPEQAAATWALADRFACQVRLRATMHDGQPVDVTRNLTVRHTGRLQGPNRNHNARAMRFEVIAVQKKDAKESDLDNSSVPQTRYRFLADDGTRLAGRIEVPLHTDWTYFMLVEAEREHYESPFEPDLIVREDRSRRWYYYRQDAPGAEHQFFVTDDDQEAEMYDLDDTPRIMADGVGSRFRVVAVVRDHRDDWVTYHAVPGTGVIEGIVEFVAP